MQELWQQISDNKRIYGRLWSFGVRSLRFRECGLYEASDLLLGDHLTEKSTTVKWIDVSMPQNRQHQLKDHRLLKNMAAIFCSVNFVKTPFTAYRVIPREERTGLSIEYAVGTSVMDVPRKNP